MIGFVQHRRRALIACGAAAGPAFIGTFTVTGARRAGYVWRRHSVSSLACGPAGWIQQLNFIVAGLLYVAGAVGLAGGSKRAVGSRATPAFVAAAGIGLIGSGLYVTDPVSGYPIGSSAQSTTPSRTGQMHNACAVPIFVGIPLAAAVAARSFRRSGDRPWTRYSVGTSVAMAATTVLFGAAFGQNDHLVARGGLIQRASIATGFGWLTAVSIRALASTPDG